MEIYLTRIILNTESRRVWDDLGNLQRLHKTISGAFPKIENQESLPHHERKTPRNQFNLLHRLEVNRTNGKAVLFVQSTAKPDWRNLHEDYALEIKCKTVHEQYSIIENGMNLLFRLQVNPTKRIGKNYQHPNEKLRDGFEKKFRDEKNRRRIAMNTDDERIEWLARKGVEAGFRFEAVKIAPEVQNVASVGNGKIAFRKERKSPKITFGSVTFEGVLQVTDAEKFRESLIQGIGMGKAYGFGLLSIAPAKEN